VHPIRGSIPKGPKLLKREAHEEGEDESNRRGKEIVQEEILGTYIEKAEINDGRSSSRCNKATDARVPANMGRESRQMPIRSKENPFL